MRMNRVRVVLRHLARHAAVQIDNKDFIVPGAIGDKRDFFSIGRSFRREIVRLGRRNPLQLASVDSPGVYVQFTRADRIESNCLSIR